MPNSRYFFSLLKTFFNKFKGIILLGILSGSLIFVLSKTLIPLLFAKNTEYIGVVGRYRLDGLPVSILNLVSNGLTKVGEDGTPEPAIASSWESGENGRVWTFHLNTDKFWQDGKKITSQAIQTNFSDVETERPDDKTITFKLKDPFAPFPVIVSRPLFKKGLLGNGEWEVKKVRVSGNTVKKLTLADKNGNKKIYNFYPTEERAKLALKLGEINILSGIFNPEPFNQWPTLTAEKTIDYGKYVAVLFNTNKEKLTGDKILRQALNYAIDKENFEGPRVISPISPDSWAYNPQVKPYNYDGNKAQEIINDLSKEVKQKLTLELTTTPVLLNEAELIIKAWETIGVKANIKVIPNVPEEFDTILAIFDVPQDPDQYAFWHSSQKNTNLADYQNQRIDKLLEDGRTVLDKEARKKIYLDFQRFLVEDSPAIFLYHPISYTITRN